MKNEKKTILLALNGKPKSQLGIEYIFNPANNKIISHTAIFNLEHQSQLVGFDKAWSEFLRMSKSTSPDIIFFFHVASIPMTDYHFQILREQLPKVKIIYDEGDMYGGLAKRINFSMKVTMRNADAVSIRGLGKWKKTCQKYNRNIFFIPHINSIPIEKEVVPKINRRACIVGNKISSKAGRLLRLPGAHGREEFVKYLDNNVKQLSIFGKGWNGLKSNCGSLDFFDQAGLVDDFSFQFAYEHYPRIPNYWSDRMPIALVRGQIYIVHEHLGYSSYFKGLPGVFFFKTNQEALEIYYKLLKESDEYLLDLMRANIEHAPKYFDGIAFYSNIMLRI